MFLRHRGHRPAVVACRVTAAFVTPLLLVVGLLAPVDIAQAAALPLVVLDPDWANTAFATWGGTTYQALPITQSIANQVAASLPSKCQVQTAVTHQVNGVNPTSADRYNQMAGSKVSLTLALDALTGTPWDNTSAGDSSGGGGTKAFYPQAGNGRDNALSTGVTSQVAAYTGRPIQGVNNQTYTGSTRPDPKLATLPGVWSEAWLLYMDNNYDAPAISVTTGDYHLLVNAVGTALVNELTAEGVPCGAAYPGPPSAAQLAALYALGFANWMRYGSDPVNFATGSFTLPEQLVHMPGIGGVSTDISLTYNSADPRSGIFGNGWSSSMDIRSQTFSDNSVLITQAGGQATAYNRNADGSYTAALPGIYSTLTRTATHTLVLTQPDTSTQTFNEDQFTGAGNLVSSTDRAGHTWTYGYFGYLGQSVLPAVPGQAAAPLPLLAWIKDPNQQMIGFSTADGRITQVSNSVRSWNLAYDLSWNLTSLTDGDGHVTRFGYDTAHRMTTVTAPDGVTYVTNTYDSAGRVVKQVNGDGNASTIAYNADGTTTYADTTGAKTTFTMDSSGRVTKVVTPLNHTLSTGYGNWNTTTSSDGDNNTTSYAYDTSGHLTSVTRPAGDATSYSYTAQGDLASKTLPDGRVTSYTVDPKGHVTAVAGPDGAHWQQAFDAVGNLTSRTDPDGHKTSYQYGYDGDLTQITDPAGGVVTMTYDYGHRLLTSKDQLGRVTTYSYDAVGNLTAATTPSGAKTSYTYQADDRVATVTNPNGGVTKYSYNNGLQIATISDPDGGVTSYGYDSEYRRTSVTDPDGHVTKYGYDAEGELTMVTDPAGGVTKKTYDAAQNLISVTDPTGAVTTIGYDADNRPTTVTDPRGGKTVFGYDVTGRLATTTDQLGRKSSYSYDAGDRVLTVTDPAGDVTRYGYDLAGNTTSSTDATGRATSYTYDVLNRVIAKADPAGNKTTYGYDAASQLTKVTDPAGRATSYSYTPDGLRASTTDNGGGKTSYAYDASGNITGITDPRGGTITFAYNGVNQVTVRTNQDGDTTSYSYTPGGLQSAMTDPAGVVTSYAHDPRGLLTQVVQNALVGQAASATVNVTTSYSYDGAGRMSSTTDPNGHTTSYGYDASGNRISTTNALGKTATSVFDAANELTASTDGNAATTSRSYDTAGRLTGVTPPAPQHAISYSYDAAGRRTGMSDGTGTSSWAYDTAGRVSSTTNGAGKTLTYGYDAAGVRTSLTLPDGKTTTYTLDAVGRIAAQTDGTGTVSYSYDPTGHLTKISRPNGTTSTYGYDPAGLITSITHTGSSSIGTNTVTATDPTPTQPNNSITGPGCGNGGVTPGCPAPVLTATDGLPLTLTYGYDADGRVTSQAQASASKDLTSNYSYDPIGRLTASTRNDNANATYSYDAAGNRTGGTETDRITGFTDTVTATFSAANQLLTHTVTPQITSGSGYKKSSTVATANSYDNDGNLTTAAVTTTTTNAGNSATHDTTLTTTNNTYNWAGQLLTSTRSDGPVTSYSYDGLGRTAGETLPDPATASTTQKTNNTNGNTGGPGCGNGGTTNGCPATDPTPFAGKPVTLTNDGNTAVEYTIATLTLDVNYGPQGADHQTTTTTGGTGTSGTGTGATTTPAWYHLDRQATPRALSNSAGATIAATAYTDYGTPEPDTGTLYAGPGNYPAGSQIQHDTTAPVLPAATSNSPLGYTAQQANPCIGLLHYQARDYQPTTAQWLQPDPWAGLSTRPTSLNKYGYVENNPTTNTDLGGYMLLAGDGGGGGAPDPCASIATWDYYECGYTPPPSTGGSVSGGGTVSGGATTNPGTSGNATISARGGNNTGGPNYSPPTSQQAPSQGSQHAGYSEACIQRSGKVAGEFPNSCPLTAPDNGTGTGICGGVEGTLVSAGLNASICEITVGNGDIVDVSNLGPTLGTAIGLNRSVSVIAVSTNAATADDLRGWFGYSSFSAELGGIGVTITCATGSNATGSNIYICGGGWAGGAGISFSGGGSYTRILRTIKR